MEGREQSVIFKDDQSHCNPRKYNKYVHISFLNANLVAADRKIKHFDAFVSIPCMAEE